MGHNRLGLPETIQSWKFTPQKYEQILRAQRPNRLVHLFVKFFNDVISNAKRFFTVNKTISIRWFSDFGFDRTKVSAAESKKCGSDQRHCFE